mgnify:FL=1
MTAIELIQDVEDQLAAIYRFPLVTSAVPFFMNPEQLVKETADLPTPRAAVFLTQTPETLDIGIFIEQQFQL